MASLCHRPTGPGVFGQTAVKRAPGVQRCRVQICASYKNKENIDLSKVAAFAQHVGDVGGTAVQIARLSARVEQLTLHMQNNRKDHSSKRGLQAVLSQRKSLMQYLYKTNRSAYDKVVVELGIRSVIAGDSHKAAQRAAAEAAQ
eukprot:GHRQ01001927.1.p1 GENE.GHRQ01001927.1~~GHRQ01001927.1.p1  ORF type:complete len:144 (+),score=54.94 GHRQ01001927.1:182-613(+)